ncbi:hypothetical protein PQX77_016296 [Marasmius sp. AFHP31]|nr:hypothetical protein PQX77_016296 [Marasmius sp. AFHP31]
MSNCEQREHRGAVIGWSPWLQRWAAWVPDPLLAQGKHQSNELDRIARQCILRRLQNPSDHVDVLGHFIQTQKQKGETPDVDVLVSEAITVLIAGTDASTNAMTATIHLISTHPSVYGSLRRELNAALGKCAVPTSDDQIANLPYLNACVYEALRYHSPTGMGLPRVSSGFEFRGHQFPPGIDVSIPTWTMSHEPTLWGEDSYSYRPERWIEDPSLSKYFMAFSMGARSCLGRNLAIMELKMAAACLFQRYDVEPRSPHLETVDKLMHKPTEESGWFRLRRRDIDV